MGEYQPLLMRLVARSTAAHAIHVLFTLPPGTMVVLTRPPARTLHGAGRMIVVAAPVWWWPVDLVVPRRAGVARLVWV